MNTLNAKAATLPSYLESERLLLRVPRLEDALELFELAECDADFARATVGSGGNSLEDACTAIVRMLTERRAGGGSWWLIEDKTSGRLVGLTGFSARTGAARATTALAKEFAGCGFAKEAIELLAKAGRAGPAASIGASASSERSTATEEFGGDVRWYWAKRPPRSGPRRCA